MAQRTIHFKQGPDDECSVEVTVNIGRMTPDQVDDLHSLFGNMAVDESAGRLHSDLNITKIRNTVLSYTLKGIQVDDREYKVLSAKPLSRLPIIENVEYMDNVTDEILTRAVERNKVLARKDPFKYVFARFLPEEERDEDPTDFRERDETPVMETPQRIQGVPQGEMYPEGAVPVADPVREATTQTGADSYTSGASSSSEISQTPMPTRQPSASGS